MDLRATVRDSARSAKTPLRRSRRLGRACSSFFSRTCPSTTADFHSTGSSSTRATPVGVFNFPRELFGKRPHRRIVTARGCEWIRPILTPSNTCFLRLTRVSPQTASRSVQPFLHSSPVCPTHIDSYRHTDHATCNICSNIGRISCTACRRCGLKIQARHVLHSLCFLDSFYPHITYR